MQDERLRRRLGRLRERFSGNCQVRDVDKDERFVTSARMEHVDDRAFFLGELFWVSRQGWNGCGGFGSNESREHHPGVVFRKQACPYKPVDMVPGSTKLQDHLDDGTEAHIFSPASCIKWDGEDRGGPETQFFVLDYARPVVRLHIGGKLGRMHYADQVRLQKELTAFEQGNPQQKDIEA